MKKIIPATALTLILSAAARAVNTHPAEEVFTTGSPLAEATGQPAPAPVLAETTAAVELPSAAGVETTPAPARPAESPQALAPGFTDAQKAQIGEVAADYLRAHPDILAEMSRALREREQVRQQDAAVSAALKDLPALLSDPASPVLHLSGDVAVVQFFDYQCIYCAKMAPVVEQFISSNPDVRFIYKEWPIFGSRWPVSGQAARVGLAVASAGGAETYHRYHSALYASGHSEGRLTEEDIRAAVDRAGVQALLHGGTEGEDAALENVNALAKRLGIQGTPAFFILPVKGATADNVTVIPGATSPEALQAAVERARGGEKKGE